MSISTKGIAFVEFRLDTQYKINKYTQTEIGQKIHSVFDAKLPAGCFLENQIFYTYENNVILFMCTEN